MDQAMPVRLQSARAAEPLKEKSLIYIRFAYFDKGLIISFAKLVEGTAGKMDPVLALAVIPGILLELLRVGKKSVGFNERSVSAILTYVLDRIYDGQGNVKERRFPFWYDIRCDKGQIRGIQLRSG